MKSIDIKKEKTYSNDKMIDKTEQTENISTSSIKYI